MSDNRVTAPRNSVMVDNVRNIQYDGASNISGITGYTAAALQNIRQCPQEEFFTLCLLTIKMKYQKYDKVMGIKSKLLFKKATS
jgi:hypothetical protein